MSKSAKKHFASATRIDNHRKPRDRPPSVERIPYVPQAIRESNSFGPLSQKYDEYIELYDEGSDESEISSRRRKSHSQEVIANSRKAIQESKFPSKPIIHCYRSKDEIGNPVTTKKSPVKKISFVLPGDSQHELNRDCSTSPIEETRSFQALKPSASPPPTAPHSASLSSISQSPISPPLPSPPLTSLPPEIPPPALLLLVAPPPTLLPLALPRMALAPSALLPSASPYLTATVPTTAHSSWPPSTSPPLAPPPCPSKVPALPPLASSPCPSMLSAPSSLASSSCPSMLHAPSLLASLPHPSLLPAPPPLVSPPCPSMLPIPPLAWYQCSASLLPTPPQPVAPESTELPSMDTALPPTPDTSEKVQPKVKEKQELKGETLHLLSEDPKKETLSWSAHNETAMLWQEILIMGMTKKVKEKLLESYSIPKDFELLLAPALNPKIKETLQDSMQDLIINRDLAFMYNQNQIGIALSALASVIEMIISNEMSKQELLKPIYDACRILCDSHFWETKIRRNYILSSIDMNSNLKNALFKTKRGHFLFGESFDDEDKATKTTIQ